MVMIVLCDVPLLWETNMGVAIMKKEEPAKYSTKNWLHNTDQNDALLQLLLDWREKVPGREVHFTCGIGRGTHGAAESVIKAPITPEGVLHTMPMLLAGPMTELVEPCAAPSLLGKQGKWEFKHMRKEREVVDEETGDVVDRLMVRNYALLDVVVDEDEKGDVGVVQGELLDYKEALAKHRPKNGEFWGAGRGG